MRKQSKRVIEIQAKLFDRLLTVMEQRQRTEYAKVLGKLSTPNVRAQVARVNQTETFTSQQKYWSAAFAAMRNAKASVKAKVMRRIFYYEGIILDYQTLWQNATCYEYRWMLASASKVKIPAHMTGIFDKFHREHRSLKRKLLGK